MPEVREPPCPDPDCEGCWHAAGFSGRTLLEKIWVSATSRPAFQGLLELDSTAPSPLWGYRNGGKIGEVKELMNKEIVNMIEFRR